MARPPFSVGLGAVARVVPGAETWGLRLHITGHPEIAPLFQDRALHLFVGTRAVVDEDYGRYTPDTPVVLLCVEGQASVVARWVDEKQRSWHCALGLFLDRAESVVIPPGVWWQTTYLMGGSRIIGFQGLGPGQSTLDEVRSYPPGYDRSQSLEFGRS